MICSYAVFSENSSLHYICDSFIMIRLDVIQLHMHTLRMAFNKFIVLDR